MLIASCAAAACDAFDQSPEVPEDPRYVLDDDVAAEVRGVLQQDDETSRQTFDDIVRDTEAFAVVSPGVRVAAIERGYGAIAEKVVIVRVDLRVVELEVVPVPDRRFERAFAGPDVLFAINGGFFDASFRPSGLAVSRGETISAFQAGGGSGVLWIEDGIATLRAADGARVPGATFAIQSGPRLIEPDGTFGIHGDDAERARRSAICVHDGGRVLDFIVVYRRREPDGPGLRSLAEWMYEGMPYREPRCEAALNLDGGPSTALDLRDDPKHFVRPHGPVVQAIVGRARRGAD